MNGNERGRYYHQRNKERDAQRQACLQMLRWEVRRLEIELEITRQLGVLPVIRASAARQIALFITDQLDAGVEELRDGRLELCHIRTEGATVEAPVIRLEYTIRGLLPLRLIHHLYQFVVGNTSALRRMMYEEVEYECTCFFHFSADGSLERFVIERDVVQALGVFLGGLRVLGQVLGAPEMLP